MSKALKQKTEAIKDLLINDRALLEMAVVAIYQRQTASEQSTFSTRENNGIGFAGCDSINGTVMAKYILTGIERFRKSYGQNLSGKWVDKALKMMPKYAGQLARIELEKEEGGMEPDDPRSRIERNDAVMRPGGRLFQNEEGESEWEMYEREEQDA